MAISQGESKFSNAPNQPQIEEGQAWDEKQGEELSPDEAKDKLIELPKIPLRKPPFASNGQ